MLSDPTYTVLGSDPTNRKCRINCYAFQQDAIVSFQDWQYAAFYSPLSPEALEPLYVHLARRRLGSKAPPDDGDWQVLVFTDYPQTIDDGHNTVQLGISPGDGTIHLSYDHHCDVLRYRYSCRNLGLKPAEFSWTSSNFTATLDYLPGLPASHQPFHYVTYPRFCAAGPDLLFTLRDGKAGLGNDHLYLYSSASGHFSYVGQHLTGIRSNPYIHGLSYRSGRLHVTWVYRGFVHYDGWDDLADTKHRQQAGPNGAENNHDLCYAYSDDLGKTWKNGQDKVISSEGFGPNTIDNDSEGIVAFHIPKGSGLTNQESQVVDLEGGVHILNRSSLPVGSDEGTVDTVRWKHYYKAPGDGPWIERALRPVYGSARGRLAVANTGDILIILPDAEKGHMHINRATKGSGFAACEAVWSGKGLWGEPLVDQARLESDNILSLMVLADAQEASTPQLGSKNVLVLDFEL
ncbi:hypothetical protein QBC40DRAFT_251593 [Triangularia verruculosa]|uniref:Dockerin type 1 n=1 Tax=Triangularia verruculosa TaxID=2587418 RepID=A0AAN6XPB2_9PEZI|nr:hypothetical protein QBC40DRAFT_251593 [Triangularia verruculosa]